MHTVLLIVAIIALAGFSFSLNRMAQRWKKHGDKS
jgi:hypothetical protein